MKSSQDFDKYWWRILFFDLTSKRIEKRIHSSDLIHLYEQHYRGNQPYLINASFKERFDFNQKSVVETI